MSIKYYHLAKDEEPPEEFCAIRDIGGEPSEYMFYVPESEVTKLRELVRDYDKMLELALADYRGFDAPLSDATHIALQMRAHKLKMDV